MQRPCIEPGCPRLTLRTRCQVHERQHQQRRNADPKRRELYDADWQRHSAQRRQEQPWCSVCGISGDLTGLTVDHPTDAVLCRPCHGRLEARRRAEGPMAGRSRSSEGRP